MTVSMGVVVSFQFPLKFPDLLLELLHLFLNRLDALVVIWMMVAPFYISHGCLLSKPRHSDASREPRIFQCGVCSSNGAVGQNT